MFKLINSKRDCYLPSFKIYTKRVSSSRFLAKLSRLINNYLYSFGLGSFLNRYDNSLSFYSSFSDKNLYSKYNRSSIFCNFGSGAFHHKKWKNYDYPSSEEYYKFFQGEIEKDFISIDLCSPNLKIPENNDSVSLIFCSHVIEHLEDNSVKKFLKECYRIMKPNSVMRIVIPNTSSDFKILELISKQKKIKNSYKAKFASDIANHINSNVKNKLDKNEIQSLIYKSKFDPHHFFLKAIKKGVSQKFNSKEPGFHISFWDYKKLYKLSKEIGFKFCLPMYQTSTLARPFSNLHVFSNTEPQLSLYIELVK